MADKRIIDRIKKLLALAKDNQNVAEATSAALKAQKLIAEYDVSKAELHEDEPENIEEVSSGNIKGNPWAKSLAHAISNNFRCRHFVSSEGTKSYWTGRTTKTCENIVFIGYDTDANAAAVTYDRLFEIGNKLAAAECRRVKKETGTAEGVRNSFLMGFVKGIRDELEKQSVALVLIRPKAVDDYTAERTAGFKNLRYSLRNAHGGSAYESGQRAGRDSVRSARIGGQKALSA